MVPIEAKLAKPASANVTITTVTPVSLPTFGPKAAYATNSLSTVFWAHVRTCLYGLAPRHTEQPREGGEGPADQALEREVVDPYPAPDARQDAVGQRDERDEGDEQGPDRDGDPASGECTAPQRVDGVGRLLVGTLRTSICAGVAAEAPLGVFAPAEDLPRLAMSRRWACRDRSSLGPAGESSGTGDPSSVESGQIILAIRSPAGAFITVAASRCLSGAPNSEYPTSVDPAAAANPLVIAVNI
jgi:hypothetical protein